MFVSHCPDPGLALSFQFKPAEQWSLPRFKSDRIVIAIDRIDRIVTLLTCFHLPSEICDDPVPNILKQLKLSLGQSRCSHGQLNPNASPVTPNASMQQLVGMIDEVITMHCLTVLI